MLRSFRDLLVKDPEDRVLVDVKKDGDTLPGMEGVYLEMPEGNIQQPGDRWGAQAANLVAQLEEEEGTAYLAIDEGEEGADRGYIKVYRAPGKPATLPHGRFCLTPHGLFVGNANNLPTPAGPITAGAPPTVDDDSTKGYANGNIWNVGHTRFVNLLNSGYLSMDNWEGVSSIQEGRNPVVSATFGIGSGVATLHNAITSVPDGHVVYVLAKMYRNVRTSIQAASLLDGEDAPILNLEPAGDDGGDQLKPVYHGRLIANSFDASGFRMESYWASVSGFYEIGLNHLMVIDLTAALGQGNEWTNEQAYAFFSQYSWQDSYVFGQASAHMCFDASPGAAIWRELSFLK